MNSSDYERIIRKQFNIEKEQINHWILIAKVSKETENILWK